MYSTAECFSNTSFYAREQFHQLKKIMPIEHALWQNENARKWEHRTGVFLCIFANHNICILILVICSQNIIASGNVSNVSNWRCHFLSQWKRSFMQHGVARPLWIYGITACVFSVYTHKMCWKRLWHQSISIAEIGHWSILTHWSSMMHWCNIELQTIGELFPVWSQAITRFNDQFYRYCNKFCIRTQNLSFKKRCNL